MPHTKRYQWNKLKRSSILDDVQQREKTMKGPADYSPEFKRKIPGVYNSAVPTGSLMNETDFLSAQSPGSNAYKPNYEAQAKSIRVPRADMNRDKSPKDPMIALKKNDSPSPSSYKDKDNNWKKMSNYPVTNFNYSIAKTVKKSFTDEHMQAKKKVPQVGTYNDSMDRFLKLSRGTNIPRYKRGK